MKTVIDLMREYVRVSDMCDAYNKEHGTDVKPWECVRMRDWIFRAHPDFNNASYENIEFALAILGGKPVFEGDTLYTKTGLPFTVSKTDWIGESSTWTPPAKPRMFMLEFDEAEMKILLDHTNGYENFRIKDLHRKITAARDKE